ncbi:MAG: hypothetical protein ABR511_02945 [Acidimicrobiales bacterium]
MPVVALVTIAIGGVLAATLVAAVSVILIQLTRTSAVLGDVDVLLADLPRALAPLAPTIGRITTAVGRLRP